MATKGHRARAVGIAKQLRSFGLALLLGVSACGKDAISLDTPDGGDVGLSTTDDGPSSDNGIAACSQCGSSCVDLAKDVNNCGSCNNQCSAGRVCRGGQCACAGNQALCGAGANASCADLMADLSNCGACGNQCAANTTCHAGKCVCPGTGMLCGANVNAACTSLTNDQANCGTCGNACPPGANCEKGACVCPAGLQLCGSANTAICADTMTDHANCGACGTPCASGSACLAGKCIPCAAMTSGQMCGTPPVCVDTSTDRGNCGMCGAACLPSEICRGGTCVCPTGEVHCKSGDSQSCVVLSSDQNNCGACGNVCTGGQICQSSACICPPGYHNCSDPKGATCIPDNSTSTSSCGTTCGVCPVPSDGNATCSGNPPTCGQNCPPEHPKLCGGGNSAWCADTMTDTDNCGGCNHTCNWNHAVPRCSNGSCSIASCTGSFQDCDNNPDNGCETDTNSDPYHCGRCNKQCNMTNGSESCVNGSCTLSHCNFPWINCDHNPDTGCNVNGSNDFNNCGGCNHQCASGGSCNNGNCVCPPGSIQCGNQCVSCPARPTNGSLTCAATGQCAQACNNSSLPNLCGNDCVNLQTDQNNCGGCGIQCVPNNKCDLTFTCQAAVCKASNPKTCTPSDACHVAGCDPATGCTNSPKTCPPPADACHLALCDPSTGCNPAIPCPPSDACHVGGCDPNTGCTETPKTCLPSDACHVAGCDPNTGCTQTPKMCVPSDACHVAGCNPSTGCTETPKHCQAPATCQSDGSCACSPPTTLCGRSCVDLQSDKNNCGMCGKRCPAGGDGVLLGACVAGQCI